MRVASQMVWRAPRLARLARRPKPRRKNQRLSAFWFYASQGHSLKAIAVYKQIRK